MGIYGIDFYGVGRFGKDPTVIRPDFSVEPFTSMALDYATLHISWVKPESTDCTNLRLVHAYRNLSQYGGQPPGTTEDADAQADGRVLFTDDVNRPQAFTDPNLGGGFIYYTMWGWSNSTSMWVRCSDLIGLVPLNWGYGARLYDLLPMAYRDRDLVMVDPYNPWTLPGDVPPLQRFMRLIGFQTDFLRTELESLTSINDPANCSGALLPLMAQQYGLPHEPEIGMQQERELIQNAVHLYKAKGSPRGLTEFCSIMTNYPATSLVHHGYNCLLTLDDAIAADGIGTWQPWPPSNITLTSTTLGGATSPAIPAGANAGLSINYNPDAINGPDPVTGMTDPDAEIYPGITFGPPAYTNSTLEISASGTNIIASAENSSFEGGTTGTWVAATNCAISNQPVSPLSQGSTGVRCMGLNSTKNNQNTAVATLAGTAVTAGHTYLVNANFLSTGPNRQCQITLQWSAGSPSVSQQFIEVTNQWTTVAMTATAPTGATSVTIVVTVLGVNNGELHYVDDIWLGAGGTDCYITTGPIPITDFMSQFYAAGNATFRFQIWSNTGPRQVELSLWGDNGSGTAVQILPPQTFTERLNHWQLMTISGPINPYPGSLPGDVKPTGPASYYWIYPRIRIIGVSTGTHYITLAGLWPCTLDQIGAETAPLGYDYPRDVKVVLQPQASNLLSNTITTFQRTNPTAGQPPINIGFDGLTTAVDPMNPTGPSTAANMSIHPQTLEDAPNSIAVHGTSALQVDATGSGATVWFGQVQNWSSAPTTQTGWWTGVPPASPAWFTGAVPGASTPRPWVDPDDGLGTIVNSWFTMPEPNSSPPFGLWFGLNLDIVNGLWFNLPPQPPQYDNLTMFNVQNGQPFNFSLWARWLSVVDPSNALMDIGFRWIYTDGTYVDSPQTTYETLITNQYARYSVAPVAPTNLAYLGEPPIEVAPPTGQYPIGVFPFVRFPSTQHASILLNAAMLSPTVTMPAYMDSSSFSTSTGDFLQDPVTGASYYFQRRTPRIARLNAELYRWLPMNSTYTIQYMSGAVMPPLDPTLWPKLRAAMVATTSFTVTPT